MAIMFLGANKPLVGKGDPGKFNFKYEGLAGVCLTHGAKKKLKIPIYITFLKSKIII